jgi:NADH-quinone oxidoreductase subunit N
MLAYSSIAHGGYLIVGVAAANEMASGAMLFYLLVYTLMNIGAFAVVISVAHQGEDRLQIEDYAGFGWQQPLLGVFLTIFLLSLAGFPGTGGFIGKIFLLQGALDADLWTLSIVLVMATLVSYWYYLRVAWYMWMREAPGPDAHTAVFTPVTMRFALFTAAGLILFLGIFPSAFGFLDFVQSSVESLWNVGGMMAQGGP